MGGLKIDVLTLFPGIYKGFLGESILKRAIDQGLLAIGLHNWRDFAENRHGTVDDMPYGGGPGMVLCPGPIFRAAASIGADKPEDGMRRIMLTPQGQPLQQALLQELAQAERLVLLCGRYEGFDDRVRTGLGFEEVSIGDYVINGGEVAAMVVIEGVLRLLPGALGDARSACDESFAHGMLEYPHFTRPPEYEGMTVPEVLLSGHHGKIAEWRERQAEKRTQARRKDLLARKKHAPEA